MARFSIAEPMEIVTDTLIGDTRVVIGSFGPTVAGLSRREREREATAWLLRHTFGEDAAIELSHAPNGAPRLRVDGGEWHLSVSHSRARAAIALSRHHRIGIDVEEWRDQLERVRHKFIAPDEEEGWGNRLLDAWMAKEAAYKAFEPSDSITVLSVSLHGTTASYGAARASLHFGDGFALAVVQSPAL